MKECLAYFLNSIFGVFNIVLIIMAYGMYYKFKSLNWVSNFNYYINFVQNKSLQAKFACRLF